METDYNNVLLKVYSQNNVAWNQQNVLYTFKCFILFSVFAFWVPCCDVRLEWEIVMQRVEKYNFLMLLQEENNLDCMYSNRSSWFCWIHIWFIPPLG